MTEDQRGVLGHGLFIFAVTCGLALAGTVTAVPAFGYKAGGGVPYALVIFLPVAWALVAAVALILARACRKNVWVFNLTMAFGIAGVAVSAAFSLSANTVLIIFSLLAFYDIVAVYATGHMVRMFRDLASRGVIFAFVLPPTSAPTLAKKMYLGTGDVALPAMLAAMAVRGGLAHGVAASLGAMVGYALMFVLFTRQTERRPMPAFPPIALGATVFYLASLILLP